MSLDTRGRQSFLLIRTALRIKQAFRAIKRVALPISINGCLSTQTPCSPDMLPPRQSATSLFRGTGRLLRQYGNDAARHRIGPRRASQDPLGPGQGPGGEEGGVVLDEERLGLRIPLGRYVREVSPVYSIQVKRLVHMHEPRFRKRELYPEIPVLIGRFAAKAYPPIPELAPEQGRWRYNILIGQKQLIVPDKAHFTRLAVVVDQVIRIGHVGSPGQGVQAAGQEVGHKRVVRIKRQQGLAAGLGQTGISHRAGSARMRQRHDPVSGKGHGRQNFARQLHRAVAAGVVNEKDLDVPGVHALARNGVKAAGQETAVIVIGDDYGNLRPFGRGVGMRRGAGRGCGRHGHDPCSLSGRKGRR